MTIRGYSKLPFISLQKSKDPLYLKLLVLYQKDATIKSDTEKCDVIVRPDGTVWSVMKRLFETKQCILISLGNKIETQAKTLFLWFCFKSLFAVDESKTK